jgi:hypothetical protein
MKTPLQALRMFKELHAYRESTRRPNEDGDLELPPWHWHAC